MRFEIRSPEPAGLYIHVPFCATICPFCDFATVRGDGAAKARYVAAVLSEIASYGGTAATFDTVYFGGGTPSTLAAADLERILAAIRGNFDLAPGAPVFLEANPEDVTAASAAAWRDLGVRFLSVGIQSIHRAELRFLGRAHRAPAGDRALKAALGAGFQTVSADIMFGLPDQGRSALRESLERVAAAGVQHVSGYQLTIHERTPFHRMVTDGRLVELDIDAQADLFHLFHETLAGLGFAAYEVSNFARSPDHRSRHNLKYWRHVPWLGVGPSAHSFDGRSRWWNEPDPAAWGRALEEGGNPVVGSETLAPRALALERIALSLRTTEGLDTADFDRRFGSDLIAINGRRIEEWSHAGLVAIEGTRLVPTIRGLAVADHLALCLDPGVAAGPGRDEPPAAR